MDWWKRDCYIKMSYFPSYSHSRNKMEDELNFPNYATKSDLKSTTYVDTSQFSKKDDSDNLKSELDQKDIVK